MQNEEFKKGLQMQQSSKWEYKNNMKITKKK